MNNYFGKYRAFVRDVADPKKLARVRCHVPEVLGHNILTAWALPVLPIGMDGKTGAVSPPPLGSKVWVEFEAGCVDRPIYTGGWAAEPSGASELPDLALGAGDETAQSPKGTDTFTMRDGYAQSEPPVPFDAAYPHNKVLKTKQGLVIELDDTPGKERIHIWHRQKSWIEIHPNGNIVLRSAGKTYRASQDTDAVHAHADRNVMVDGTLREQGANVKVMADSTLLVDSGGTVDVRADTDVNVQADEDATVTAGGTISISATGNVSIASLGGEVSMTGTGTLRLEGGASVQIIGTGVIEVNSPNVQLAGGGPPVARLGDMVIAGPHVGTIITGSGRVVSG